MSAYESGGSQFTILSRDDFERLREESYREGWNAALDHVRESNGEGSRDYL